MIFTDDFFSTGSTLPNDDLVQLVDSNTFENVNYQKVNNLNWYHDAGDIYVDGIIIRERGSDHYALTSFLAGKPINIELFGAIGDSITDDKAAFLKAAEFVNNQPDHISLNPSDPNENVIFEIPAVTITGNSPVGYKIMDTISFEKPVNFLVDKIFYRGEKDRPALIFKNSYKNTITTNVSAYQSSDFSSDDFVGILIQYAQHSKMYLGASFFTKGIVCEADGSKAFSGFAWNEIQLKSLQSNLDSFVIRNINNGWANMNRLVGGEFGAFSGTVNPITQHRMRTFVKFEKDNLSKGCNSWLFLNQAFEWNAEIDPWETLCFDFSAEPCFGISILEPRIESKPGIKRIEKVKFLEIPEDTYPTIDDISGSNLTGFNFNTGEKFYNFNTYKTSVVKEPGVGSTLSGYTVDAVSGSRKIKVKTGAIDNLSIGTPFYINSTTSQITFKITEKHGDIITTNIPSDVTMTDIDIIFPVCTYDTY